MCLRGRDFPSRSRFREAWVTFISGAGPPPHPLLAFPVPAVLSSPRACPYLDFLHPQEDVVIGGKSGAWGSSGLRIFGTVSPKKLP